MPDDRCPPLRLHPPRTPSRPSRRSRPSRGRAWSTPWPTGSRRDPRGRLRPGTRLPSERELSLALGVNRLTLRASLARLEALGLITTRHGAGTVVASWRERAGLETLGTLVAGSSSPIRRGTSSSVARSRSAASSRPRRWRSRPSATPSKTSTRSPPARRSCIEHVDDPVAFARADLAFMRAVMQGRAQRRARAVPQHVRALAGRAPAARRGALRRLRARRRALSGVVDLIKSRDGELARALARRALEQLDEAWSRRHPPPAPSRQRRAEATPRAPTSRSRKARGSTHEADAVRATLGRAALGAIFPGSTRGRLRATSARWTSAGFSPS